MLRVGINAQVTGIALSVGPTILLAAASASNVGGQGQSRALLPSFNPPLHCVLLLQIIAISSDMQACI